MNKKEKMAQKSANFGVKPLLHTTTKLNQRNSRWLFCFDKGYFLIYKVWVIFDIFLASLRSLGAIFNSAGVGNVYAHMLVKKKQSATIITSKKKFQKYQ